MSSVVVFFSYAYMFGREPSYFPMKISIFLKTVGALTFHLFTFLYFKASFCSTETAPYRYVCEQKLTLMSTLGRGGRQNYIFLFVIKKYNCQCETFSHNYLCTLFTDK